jgi:hypothetical protein
MARAVELVGGGVVDDDVVAAGSVVIPVIEYPIP